VRGGAPCRGDAWLARSIAKPSKSPDVAAVAIIRAERPLNTPDIAVLCRRAFPDYRVSILREIDGGRSTARVLVVDLVASNGPTGEPTTLNGQFILKVQPRVTWPGEQPESSRHEAAASRSPEFSLGHIPRLRFSTDIDELSVVLYDIAGHSLAGFVGADAVDVGSLLHYCGLVSRGLFEAGTPHTVLTTLLAPRKRLTCGLAIGSIQPRRIASTPLRVVRLATNRSF
jgi:hypothetical protein